MDWFRFLKANRIEEKKPHTEYKADKVGSIAIPDQLTDRNAFALANSVAEIYNPIDFIADRISKLRFYIADSNGTEKIRSDYNRLIKEPNPFYSFSDLVYQAVFSLYADGNTIGYVQAPSVYGEATPSNISRIDILSPALLSITENTNVDILSAPDYKAFIRRIRYDDMTYTRTDLNVNNVSFLRYDATRRGGSLIFSRSPLFKSYRSINNLLACYSSRYNVYVNNGAAGYLYKKSGRGVDSTMADRSDIIRDLQEREGITGKTRQMIAISGVEIGFINTLANIKDLMPFEETLEDAIKIASTFQIPAILVPRADNPTFNNQIEAERSVWENTLTNVANTIAQFFTDTYKLSSVGLQIKPDFTSVSALKANEDVVETLIQKKIANLQSLAAAGIDTTEEMNKIYTSYGTR